MSLQVKLYQGESQDALLRRFQKQVQLSGILREAKTKSRFVSNRDAYRIKSRNSARRRRQQAKRGPR